ncbi:MAG: hypothetical protein ACRDBO_20015 [Lachnospiraceae bacterium]
MMNRKSGVFSMILIVIVIHLWGCTKLQENMVRVPEPALSSIAESDPGIPAPSEAERPKVDNLNLETNHSDIDIYDIAPEQISDYHPVVVNNYLIGGSNSREWFAANEFVGELTGEEVYNTYNISGYTGIRKCLAVELEEGNEPFCEMVMIGYEYGEEDVIALNASWDGMPRKPVAQTGNNSMYEDVIRELLAGYGLEDPDIEIQQNYRIDFEGDGVDEVILYAENKRKSDAEWDYDVSKGCFSLLVLRKIVGGEVENHVIYYDVHANDYDPDSTDFQYRLHFSAVGFVDVNGDGKLELVGSLRYYEGLLYDVFVISDEDAKQVIVNGIIV